MRISDWSSDVCSSDLRSSGRVASACTHRGQAIGSGAVVCRGLGGNPGDVASAGGARNARDDQGRHGRAARTCCEGAGLVSWRVVFAWHAVKDAKKLASAGLKPKAQALLDILAADPFSNPPTYEKLVGDLAGTYSRRINIPIGKASWRERGCQYV